MAAGRVWKTAKWLAGEGNQPVPASGRLKPSRVLISRRVIEKAQVEIETFPDVEVGGKFVGFFFSDQWQGDKGPKSFAQSIDLAIVDYLDDGPGARRSATYHLGDGPDQERQFRRLEKKWPEIEHLGSWHSHHPNGLRDLSSGDVDGYVHAVNHRDHHSDIFFASLTIDRHGFGRSRHFLFLRGIGTYFEVDGSAIKVCEAEEIYSLVRERRKRQKTRSPKKGDGRRETSDGRSRPTEPSDFARRTAARLDELLLDSRSTARGDRIVVAGRLAMASSDFKVDVIVPSDRKVADGAIVVKSHDSEGELADLSFFRVSLKSQDELEDHLKRISKILGRVYG